MALDLALDAKTHDLVISDYDLVMIDSAERVAQQIKVQLLTWLGEWFLDTTHGVPYLDYILVKNPNLELIRQTFRDQILAVDDVRDVTDMEVSYNPRTREVTVEYTAVTGYGLITDKEVLGYGS